MKLLTKQLTDALLKAGAENMKPICKFFNPDGCQTWLITGMENDGDTLWGYADLGFGCVEFGTISLSELQSFRGRFGTGIERDLYWESKSNEDYLGRESLVGL